MPIDSTANLLFSIGANSDDAEDNIKRFRTLLSKDLGDLEGEFEDWAKDVFGNIGTVQGAMTAATAAVAAAAVGLGAIMRESTNSYAEYVSEVERGSRITGISTEQMSGLKFMASETNTSYDALVTGLTRFATTVVKAGEGSEVQQKAFQRLGISQEQVKAGEKDMMPLLELVADRFKGLGSQVEKTAVARDLFGRGGAELIRILSLGAAGIKDFERECAELGLTITTKDVVAVNEYKAAVQAAKAAQEAFDVEVGRNSVGIMERLHIIWAGLIETVKHGELGQGQFLRSWMMNNQLIADRIGELAKSLSKMGDAGKPLDDLAPKAAKVKESFTGLTDLLEEVTAKTLETGGEEGRLAAQFDGLDKQLAKVYGQYQRLHAEGKLSAEDAAAQAAALGPLNDAFKALKDALQGQADSKAYESVERAGQQLEELVLRQGEQTLDIKNRLLDMDVTRRREAMEKEHTDTAINLAWLAAYEQAARQKITDEGIAAIEKGGDEIAAKMRAQSERSYEQKAADWNREINLEIEGLRKKEALTAQNEAALEALRKAGLAKIAADEKAAYDQEMARLGEQLERIEREHQTHGQQIAAEYQADVAKFTAAEEKKTLATATSEAQRAQIHLMFQAIREGLYTKEQQDLQQLQNSTGWQGVFGDKFATTIRGNEALSKEWATSTNQSLLMVKAAMESLNEMSQKAFQQMAQGMGANIAHAIMYKQSIGAAMKAAMEATLESLAGQAYGQAIYSLALGFLDLAEGNEAGAVQAFTAAAIFAAVGTGAALIGRSMTPAGGPGGGAGSGAGTGSGGLGTDAANTRALQANGQSGAVGAPTAASGPHVTVNVWGHVVGTSGVSQLAGMLNDAVMNQDVQLTATNTKTGVQVNQ
jgi:hypothetical protein